MHSRSRGVAIARSTARTILTGVQIKAPKRKVTTPRFVIMAGRFSRTSMTREGREKPPTLKPEAACDVYPADTYNAKVYTAFAADDADKIIWGQGSGMFQSMFASYTHTCALRTCLQKILALPLKNRFSVPLFPSFLCFLFRPPGRAKCSQHIRTAGNSPLLSFASFPLGGVAFLKVRDEQSGLRSSVRLTTYLNIDNSKNAHAKAKRGLINSSWEFCALATRCMANA